MKKKVIGISVVTLAVVSAYFLMALPVLAEDPEDNDPSATPTLSPLQQYEALQHSQTGSSIPVTTVSRMTIVDYVTSLNNGVTPSTEFAEQMRQKALQLVNQ